MIWLVVAAIVAACGATATTLVFWTTIKDLLADWLHRHNLQKSALMSATVLLDRIAVGVRRRLRGGTRAYGVQIISEVEMQIDQIDDRK